MKKRGIIIALALFTIVLIALAAAAFSNSIFFATLSLDQGEIVEREGGGTELPFYLYKDAWQKYQAQVVTLYFNVEGTGDNLVKATLELTPKKRYQVDSLNIELYINKAYSAILMQDPQTGQDSGHDYLISGDDSRLVLNFPSFDTAVGEKATINFWLDLSKMDAGNEGAPLLFSFSIHENSIFKIARHVAEQHVLNLELPVES